MPSNRLPWEDEPFVDRKAATEKAVAAAAAPRVDVKGAGIASYTQKVFNDETARVREAPDGTRNETLFKAACNLFEIAAAAALDETAVWGALMDACHSNNLIRDDGEHSVTQTLKSARRRGFDNPRDLSHVGTRINGFHLENEPVQSVSLDTVAQIERGFWTQRESLQAVYLGALARMCSPWAVLGYCAARALALVRPSTILPPLIGGPGSLNWFCAIAANSGGGKSSSENVARELVDEFILQRNLGSGEGVIDAYVKPGDKETGEPPGLHESVMFVADEIDNMAALGTRTGSTLPSILRSGFSGQTLGFSYRTASSLHLDAQSYRMTLAINVQAARAGALMDDIHGGTLQRFMWFPGTDPRVTSEVPLMPGALELPSHSAWLYPRELAVPYEAIELIRDERSRLMRGEHDVLDGHALFIREKFAYALAVLDGRDVMSSEDWRLAGIAAKVSDHTRSWVAAQLLQAQEEQAAEQGRLQGVKMNASDEERAHQSTRRLARIAQWALKKINDSEAGLTQRDLTLGISSKDRPYLAAALEKLQSIGAVSCELSERGGWHKNKWMRVEE